MEKERRARHIIDYVLAMDDRWGKPTAPRNQDSQKPSRVISDDCRWHARLTREDQKGPDGELWDLIEVHAYEELRMTAAFRGEEIDLRLFKPGNWEPLFNLLNPSDSTPRLPNEGTNGR